ncbi:unnamed protein product [Boreogadus saida]
MRSIMMMMMMTMMLSSQQGLLNLSHCGSICHTCYPRCVPEPLRGHVSRVWRAVDERRSANKRSGGIRHTPNVAAIVTAATTKPSLRAEHSRFSETCCLCCHVRTGTIILGIWYMLINAVVLLILLSALNDPVQYRYHLTSSELGTDIDVMDDANICIATAISLLMILICGMATYGAYKQHAAWIIPFFCYQIFDFALNTLVAVSVVVYPNTVQDYLQQLPGTFPYKEDIMSTNNACLVFAVLLFVGCILSFKGEASHRSSQCSGASLPFLPRFGSHGN